VTGRKKAGAPYPPKELRVVGGDIDFLAAGGEGPSVPPNSPEGEPETRGGVAEGGAEESKENKRGDEGRGGHLLKATVK